MSTSDSSSTPESDSEESKTSEQQDDSGLTAFDGNPNMRLYRKIVAEKHFQANKELEALNARAARNQNVVASLAAFMPAGADHPASPDSAADGGNGAAAAAAALPPGAIIVPDEEDMRIFKMWCALGASSVPDEVALAAIWRHPRRDDFHALLQGLWGDDAPPPRAPSEADLEWMRLLDSMDDHRGATL